MTKQQTIELLGQQLPGFYSVEQVIKLIGDIEESETFEFHSESISKLSDDIADALQSEGTDLIDDYDLTMNYKEVELDSVDFSASKIRSIVDDVLTDFLEQFKQAE
jgi:hypothetical protein